MSSSGSWKLVVYPLLIILVIGGLFTIVVNSIYDNRVPTGDSPTVLTGALSTATQQGIPFNVTINLFGFSADFTAPFIDIYQTFTPLELRDALYNDVQIFTYFQPSVQYITAGSFLICLFFGTVYLIRGN